MVDNVQDIVVSENYGRSKRASLLYGAGLIVLAVATPSGHRVSVLGAEIPLDVARILTWLAALYYTINFGFEWRVARIVNSRAMANEYGGGVNARLRALAESFQKFSERISETGNAYVAALEGLRGNIDQILKTPPITLHQSLEGVLEATGQYHDLFEKFEQTNKARIENFKMTLNADRQIAERHAQENLDAYSAIGQTLTRLASDFNTLSGRFNTEQRFMFYVLDLGAVLGIFAVGTAVAMFATLHIIDTCIL